MNPTNLAAPRKNHPQKLALKVALNDYKASDEVIDYRKDERLKESPPSTLASSNDDLCLDNIDRRNVDVVIGTWKTIKKVPNYTHVVGVALFRK